MSTETLTRALFHGARLAIAEARRWDKEATCDNRDWHVKSVMEARLCRERAAGYLQSRRFILDDAARYWNAA